MVFPRFSRFASALAAAFVLALVLIAFAGAPPAARAQGMSLFSNLDATRGSGDYIGINSNQKAVAFTTGATSFTLTSVQAYLSTLNSPLDISFGLYTPLTLGGDDPGTLVADLGTQNVSAPYLGGTPYTFTPSSGYVMTANTRYVLLCDGVNDNGQGGAGVWESGSPDVPPTAQNNSGYNTPVYRVSSNNGATYSDSTTFNLFALNGRVVSMDTPEPDTLPLLSIGIVPLAGFIARRRRKTAA